MNPQIVADGERRLRHGVHRKLQLQELCDSIKAKHASESAKAGLMQRLVLRWRMAVELRRERRKLEPTPGSLYGTRVMAKKV